MVAFGLFKPQALFLSSLVDPVTERVRTGHMVYIRYRPHSLQLPFTPILWDQMDSLGH